MAYRISRGQSGCGGRLAIAVILALGAIISYYVGTEKFENPVTGRVQRVALSPKEEIALGLNSAPEMARQHGGLYPDERYQNLVAGIGEKLVRTNPEINQSPYYFQFHLLADSETVNAFALPGGQVFITFGLLRLLDNEDEVAGVLGHEIGHVVGRHSNEQMAKAQLSQGLVNAVVMAGGTDYGMAAGQIAQFVSQLKNTAYGREDELESDQLGVRFMIRAGYDPNALIRVMEVLKKAAGGRAPPEFLSTHPDPANRVERIKEAIRKVKEGNSSSSQAPGS
jgi:beta-barrel assembly-enhancing protease